MRIACIGDNCIDKYDDTGAIYVGGNPVNVAVNIQRLGGESSYIGSVGDDVYGNWLVQILKRKKVDVSHVHLCHGATALSHIAIRNGERVFGEYDEGVMADFRPSKDDLEFLCTHDLTMTSIWGHSENVLSKVRSRGCYTAFDASDRPFSDSATIALPYSDLFFFSDDISEDNEIIKNLCQLMSLSTGIVVATRGSKGSIAFDGTEFYKQDAAPCCIVDTLGAGDSYIAGFIMAWLSRQSIPDCMNNGALSAAVTLEVSGAWKLP